MTTHKYINLNESFIVVYVNGEFNRLERIDGDIIDLEATRHYLEFYEEDIDTDFFLKIDE